MVSILDLNIWNYNEPWAKRREGIARAIREAAPDLVTLQEVTYLTKYAQDPHTQADQIAARLEGYRCVWQPAEYFVDQPRDAVRWEGVAILSRLPIIDLRHLWVPRDLEDVRDSYQRVVLGARVLTSTGPFWIFTTHLSLTWHAPERTILAVYRFVQETAAGEPFAITGDFNAHPDHPWIRFLVGQETLEGQTGAWVDAWAAAHPGDPGYTAVAWEPYERIDYVLVPDAGMVRRITIAANRPDAEGIYPSDHLGLYAELLW